MYADPIKSYPNRLHDDAMAPSSHHSRDDELQIFINLLA